MLDEASMHVIPTFGQAARRRGMVFRPVPHPRSTTLIFSVEGKVSELSVMKEENKSSTCSEKSSMDCSIFPSVSYTEAQVLYASTVGI